MNLPQTDAAVPPDPGGRAPGRGHWVVRHLGLVDYEDTFERMQAHVASRTADSDDELWLCEHRPVYTLGLAGRREHLLAPGDIPVVQSNRGGQVTYHGPGQVVAYPLLDLRRRGIYVKEYVYRLEQAIIQTLDGLGVAGVRVAGAPGVYVQPEAPGMAPDLTGPRLDPFQGLAKLAALGIKVSNHFTYHGLSLNVAMDLSPFERINPCGYAGLRTVDLATLGCSVTVQEVMARLADRLSAHLAS